MGGCKSEECNDLAFSTWSWCMDRFIWLSASHVPGCENISDYGSRHFSDNTEWKLNSQIFLKLTKSGDCLILICLPLDSIDN